MQDVFPIEPGDLERSEQAANETTYLALDNGNPIQGVVGDVEVTAIGVLALGDMTAERRRPAALDRRHDLDLLERDMATVGMTPRGTVVTEDIRNLQT